MRDLEDLASQVRSPQSRAHVDEAVTAYRAGAFRAAIMATWIAVSLDLTQKIRALAEDGDAEAQSAASALGHAIASGSVPAMQKFETSLLEVARDKFEFINHREHEELNRLYRDRNMCAHPAFVTEETVFSPTGELARAHLATAIDALLSQSAVPGKMAITRFQEALKTDTWPDPPLGAYVKDRYLKSSRESFRRNLAQVVVKGCLDVPEENRRYAKHCFLVVDALVEVAPSLIEEAVTSVLEKRLNGVGLSDVALLHVVGSLGRVPTTWSALTSSVPRIKKLIDDASEALLVTERTFYAGVPMHPAIADSYCDRLEGLGRTSLLLLISRMPNSQFVGRALEMLCGSRSFRGAEEHMSAVLDLSRFLTVNDLQEVADCVRSNNQVTHASGMPPMMTELYDRTLKTPGAKEVWKGLANWLRKAADSPDDYYAYPNFCRLALGEPSPDEAVE